MKTRLLILTGIGMIVFAGLIQMSYAEEIFMFLEKDVRKIYYTGENINSAFFDHDSASIIFELGENATLDLKIPQVYKIGGDLFVLINGEEVDENATTDDCFYYASFESKTPERLEVIFAHWAEAPERTDNCETFVVSPLKQFKSGIPINEITCKEHLQLIIKNKGNPACVKEQSVLKLTERGWVAESNSDINRGCMTLEQSKSIAPFFKVPSYLPEGYSMKCSMSGMPYESYILYHNKDVSDGWMSKMHMLIDDGAIFIHQTDEKNLVGEKFETFGTAEQRIQETYDSVINGNPSLKPQLIRINGMLAYAVDSCADCGMQTANFTDGTVIQKSTSSETRIKFIDENGVSYMLETTLPLSELIKVAESLQ